MEEIYRERLREVWAWMEKQYQLQQEGLPSEWNQKTWFTDKQRSASGQPLRGAARQSQQEYSCNTTCCLAGHVVMNNLMLTPAVLRESNVAYDVDEVYTCSDGVRTTSIATIAADYLGLDMTQASALFSALNEIDDVRFYLQKWGVITAQEVVDAERAVIDKASAA